MDGQKTNIPGRIQITPPTIFLGESGVLQRGNDSPFRYSHQHAAARGNMNLQLLFAERLMATMADMQSLSMQVTFPLAARRHVQGCLSPAV